MLHILLMLACIHLYGNQPYIDFAASMQSDRYAEVLNHDFSRLMYDRVQDLYAHTAPGVIEPRQHGTIPRVMHHIWFGKPLAESDKQLRATWEEVHLDWQFVLWTDRVENDPRGVVAHTWQEVQTLLDQGHRYITVDVTDIAFDNRTFFDETPFYGERSDILKWEIVYRLGGMYLDFDFKCFASFDAIHDQYDFYTGLQPLDTSLVQLGAALFAACPQHPILRHAVETIAANRHLMQIVLKTGPIHFSRAFYAVAGSHGLRDIAFPASFFYPCGYFDQQEQEEQWRKPESLAVHLWAGSWLKPEAIAG